MSSATHAAIEQLMTEMQKSVIGQDAVARALTIALLCNGNVMLEGLPGTAKTRSIKTLGRVLQADLGRVQFTPDLLPSDVTGTEVYQEVAGKQTLTFQEGPIFNNLLLADEINRAPAKVQSALLEAMEERQVTVAGKTYPLPELFMVLATQNPIEQEGTYPLPEAQMDRFLMKVNIDYPDTSGELGIVRLVHGEEQAQEAVPASISQQHIFEAREQVRNIHISEAVEQYLVDLVIATREPQRYSEDLQRWIQVGCSPRASIGMHRAARAEAWLAGKDFVDPDDVRSVMHPILRHRLILSYDALAEGITSDQALDAVMEQVAVS
ncbi:MoxR family ATPase [Halieaceae bacterium IMCC14734]|uniref:MoxR family ATPase n=1 Tax=Candidatus Litorirhabdus singularis TaxID=2518993 RepID=A0ABT3TBP6_9GAMM|nr:MoxR family ATPase [Candidatus Litorirhabdus singularis]MCX2979716.1 MoxR family ATPase [Candidatus Litorirhabdus singularis]